MAKKNSLEVDNKKHHITFNISDTGRYLSKRSFKTIINQDTSLSIPTNTDYIILKGKKDVSFKSDARKAVIPEFFVRSAGGMLFEGNYSAILMQPEPLSTPELKSLELINSITDTVILNDISSGSVIIENSSVDTISFEGGCDQQKTDH